MAQTIPIQPPHRIGLLSIIIRGNGDFLYNKWVIFIYFIAKHDHEKEEHNVGG